MPTQNIKGRPIWTYLRVLIVGVSRTLRLREIDWLDENEFPYHFEWKVMEPGQEDDMGELVLEERVAYYLVVDDPEVELLFKLRWGA